jgi:hypothetical protein
MRDFCFFLFVETKSLYKGRYNDGHALLFFLPFRSPYLVVGGFFVNSLFPFFIQVVNIS